LIEADPDTAAVLAAVPNESAVPLTEVGHANEPRTEHEQHHAARQQDIYAGVMNDAGGERK
jgi:hypothetical protein